MAQALLSMLVIIVLIFAIATTQYLVKRPVVEQD